jgi:hypothetical protein
VPDGRVVCQRDLHVPRGGDRLRWNVRQYIERPEQLRGVRQCVHRDAGVRNNGVLQWQHMSGRSRGNVLCGAVLHGLHLDPRTGVRWHRHLPGREPKPLPGESQVREQQHLLDDVCDKRGLRRRHLFGGGVSLGGALAS